MRGDCDVFRGGDAARRLLGEVLRGEGDAWRGCEAEERGWEGEAGAARFWEGEEVEEGRGEEWRGGGEEWRGGGLLGRLWPGDPCSSARTWRGDSHVVVFEV